ncbi:MAG: flagellar motor switch protein FliG [Elusimicrobia bacterium]|nr:MAG: flagellar motor switch protein FliG [Elusimicrobiota bacterium]KAF0156185.1 MAG: flagellar motor switch protein FliG [Elusimicrobiota bacterium]
MSIYRAISLSAALLSCFALPVRGQEKPDAADAGTGLSVIEKQDALRRETETKIKKEILDPIFGEGKSFVFADVELEIIARKADQSREGVGVMQKYKEKGGQDAGRQESEFLLPGIPKPKSIMGGKSGPPAAATGQQAQQSRGVQETRYGAETEINRFQVTVIHDETLAPEPVALARERVDDFLLPYKIKKQDAPTVVFKPTRFKSYNYLDDLKRPSVYLPLLYALLFLLLLLFLFGPLWGFFRKYIRALMAKPGAEVNIDQKMEEGGGGSGDEAGKQETEGHQAIDMTFEQKGEEEEDESMKKFEPFTYINEENLKRLIYLFLMRKEEPWVIAVVLSYIRPELSRQALSMLPIEVQSKVALEALTVRQATREQIEAIDRDIKNSVDFVMGGIERLIKMLDEADPAIKKNILDYLKTQKPDIYEKIKKVVLMFEDVVTFPDRDMQLIIRSVSNEVVARAIAKADPPIVEKFYANMSQGAASAIKEIIDYSGEISVFQIDEAQGKILDAIKTLEAGGKITPRGQQSQEVYIVDSVDMTSASDRKKKFDSLAGDTMPHGVPIAAPVSAEAQQYITAGADLYNQGRAEESLQYLEYAASQAPGSAEVQQYLGAAYYALGRVDESVAAYEKYASLSGDPAASEWLASFKQQVRTGRE